MRTSAEMYGNPCGSRGHTVSADVWVGAGVESRSPPIEGSVVTVSRQSVSEASPVSLVQSSQPVSVARFQVECA